MPVAPSPEHLAYSNTSLTHPTLTTEQAAAGATGKDRRVGRAERAERELATGAPDLLSLPGAPLTL